MDLQQKFKELQHSALDHQTAQEFMVESLRNAFKLTRVTIMLYERAANLLEATASTGHPNKDYRSIRLPVLRMDGISSRAVESRAFLENRAITVRDRNADPEYRLRRKFPHKKYAREFAVFPLSSHSRKLGILALAVDEENPTKLSPALTRKIHGLCRTISAVITHKMPKIPSDRFLARIMKDILQEGLLSLAFQPIVDIGKKRIHGYESLLRVNHPVVQGPTELLAHAEKFNLFRDISHFSNREALRVLRRLAPAQKLFLNLHPVDFREYSYMDDRANPFYKQDLSRLVFEITERHYVKDIERLNSTLKFFKGLGVGIAIDDLGSGFSSLEMLTRLEPDYIKLDMSLIRNIHQSDRKQKLLRSLLYYGEQIGARCIAEGVETKEELEVVRAMNCKFVQGFLLGVPAAELTTPAEIRKHMEEVSASY